MYSIDPFPEYIYSRSDKQKRALIDGFLSSAWMETPAAVDLLAFACRLGADGVLTFTVAAIRFALYIHITQSRATKTVWPGCNKIATCNKHQNSSVALAKGRGVHTFLSSIISSMQYTQYMFLLPPRPIDPEPF